MFACSFLIYNDLICTGSFDSSWRHVVHICSQWFGRVEICNKQKPETNTYCQDHIQCFFTKMLHDRLQPLRETEQSLDQVGFRKGPGIDHALAGFETVCRKNIEWNSKIWFASLDLTKAFGRVAQGQLFQALGSNMFRNLPWTCRGRSVLLKLARRTEVGLWIFNVELQ